MQDELRRLVVKGGVAAAAASILGLAGCNNRRRFVPLSSTEPIVKPRASTLPLAQTGSQTAAGGEYGGLASSLQIMPRSAWTGAAPVGSLVNPMNGINRITVHHDAIASSGLHSRDDSAQRLESIRKGHLAQQWADIGYHFIIDPQGRVWEGRPVQFQGAHVKLNNENNLGIMMMGNFDYEMPTQGALTSLDTFLADRMRAYRIPMSRVFTHQEIRATACPGRNLQAYMRSTRNSNGRLTRMT